MEKRKKKKGLIEKIQKSIEVLNHNSGYLKEGLVSLKEDFQKHQNHQDKCFEEFRENDTELRIDVGWLKYITKWVFFTVILGTLISIATGIIMIVITK